MNVFCATCASNRSLQTVLNPSSKEHYARSRSTSLKYLIISCVNLTLSIQSFVCYYLQLVKPYAMFYRVSHKHLLVLRFKSCLLIFLSFMYFTGVKCDQKKNTQYIHRFATNESFNLLDSVSISRFQEPIVELQDAIDNVIVYNEVPVIDYGTHVKDRHIRSSNSRDTTSNGIQFVPDTEEDKIDIQQSFIDWSRYQSLGNIYLYMQKLQSVYPQMVKVISIGKSVEHRDILVAKIGYPKPYKKPSVFIEAGIHAREWISPATATFFIGSLVENHANVTTALLNDFDVYVLPVANPDGYEYSRRKDRMWRKNRARTNSMPFSCVGVDLNRNFGYKWAGSKSNFRSSRKPCHETYIGVSPWTEPETKALRDFILQGSKAKFVMYISLHSFGQKILYPWAYTNHPIKDWYELHTIAKLFAARVYNVSRGKYKYQVGSSDGKINYNSYGNSDDWARGEAGIKWTFLIELPPTRNAFPPRHQNRGFLLPSTEILPVGYSVFQGFLDMISNISKLGYGKV